MARKTVNMFGQTDRQTGGRRDRQMDDQNSKAYKFVNIT